MVGYPTRFGRGFGTRRRLFSVNGAVFRVAPAVRFSFSFAAEASARNRDAGHRQHAAIVTPPASAPLPRRIRPIGV